MTAPSWPATFADAVNSLDQLIPTATKQYLSSLAESDLDRAHWGLGLAIRTCWGSGGRMRPHAVVCVPRLRADRRDVDRGPARLLAQTPWAGGGPEPIRFVITKDIGDRESGIGNRESESQNPRDAHPESSSIPDSLFPIPSNGPALPP
jgi:hypothetical protein